MLENYIYNVLISRKSARTHLFLENILKILLIFYNNKITVYNPRDTVDEAVYLLHNHP